MRQVPPRVAVPRRTPRMPRVDRAGLRASTALAGALAGSLTGWPVMVAMGALGGGAAPSLVGRRAGRERLLARTEALASWTESLRDLISAGSAIEATIAESARVAPRPIRSEVRGLAERAGNERADRPVPRPREKVALPQRNAKAESRISGLLRLDPFQDERLLQGLVRAHQRLA